MLLHDRTVLTVKTHQVTQTGEPNVAADVELSLTAPDNSKMVDPLVPVQEGEDQSAAFTVALPNQISTWFSHRLQPLTSHYAADGAMVPPYCDNNLHISMSS